MCLVDTSTHLPRSPESRLYHLYYWPCGFAPGVTSGMLAFVKPLDFQGTCSQPMKHVKKVLSLAGSENSLVLSDGCMDDVCMDDGWMDGSLVIV